jgi:hypothetical protein
MIDAGARSDISRLHALCQASGMRFNLFSLPQDYVGAEQTIFKLDPAEMRRLYETGYRLTTDGPAWRHTPPGADPGEEEVPRGALAEPVYLAAPHRR